MARKKGTVKTGGRKKGTVNKTTADLKAWGLDFLTKHTETFDIAFKSLPPEKKLEVLIVLMPKLMPYYLPKQTEGKFSVDEKTLETIKAVQDAQQKVNEMFKFTSVIQDENN